MRAELLRYRGAFFRRIGDRPLPALLGKPPKVAEAAPAPGVAQTVPEKVG